MIFDKHRFYKIPNGEWCAVIYGVRKIYGNVHGVNRGLVFEDTHKSFITFAKRLLSTHKRYKRENK